MYSIPVFGNKAKPARILGEPKKPEGLIERLLDSFLLSVTCRGNIVLVSGSIEKYLGHCRVSLCASCCCCWLLLEWKWSTTTKAAKSTTVKCMKCKLKSRHVVVDSELSSVHCAVIWQTLTGAQSVHNSMKTENISWSQTTDDTSYYSVAESFSVTMGGKTTIKFSF